MTSADWLNFSKQIQQQLEDLSSSNLPKFKIISASPMSGGDIHNCFHLHTNQGNYFLKTNLATHNPLFKTEANSLTTLKNSLTIRVPNVIAKGCFDNYSWLLLEFFQLSSQGDDEQRGKDLAMQHHSIEPSGKFGWHEDNFIGLTPQKNDWNTSWVDFYATQRLEPQLQLAKQNGAGDLLLAAGNKLLNSFGVLFKNYQPKSSLLHGDLWAGNSLFLENGEALFFDPACYYGDRETDLAMSELFGGFSTSFYQGYEQTFPISSGYPQRKSLYHSYHLLNHFNLFAGNYEQQSLKQIQQCLRNL